MTPEQKAAFIISQSVMAFGQIAGMMAENIEATDKGIPPKYRPPDFERVVVEHGLGHNAVIGFFSL